MQTMKKIAEALISTLCCGLFVLAVAAQEKTPEPTLAETADWITKTCDIHNPKARIKFDGLNVYAAWNLIEISGSDITMASFGTIPLKDVETVTLNPPDSKHPKWKVLLHTKRKFTLHLGVSRPSVDVYETDEFYLLFVDKQMGERMQAAFAHAVELAKAQKEPF